MTHTHTDPNTSKLQKSKVGSSSRVPTLFNEVDNLFDQLRTRDWTHPFGFPVQFSDVAQPRVPMFSEGKLLKVDIVDRDKDLLLRAELPGVDKKDLEITMTENSVTIKASCYHQQKEEKEDYYRSEITHGHYSRTVGLPADVDMDLVTTSFKDGVLELVAPKLERSQRRAIKVK